MSVSLRWASSMVSSNFKMINITKSNFLAIKYFSINEMKHKKIKKEKQQKKIDNIKNYGKTSKEEL